MSLKYKYFFPLCLPRNAPGKQELQVAYVCRHHYARKKKNMPGGRSSCLSKTNNLDYQTQRNKRCDVHLHSYFFLFDSFRQCEYIFYIRKHSVAIVTKPRGTKCSGKYSPAFVQRWLRKVVPRTPFPRVLVDPSQVFSIRLMRFTVDLCGDFRTFN